MIYLRLCTCVVLLAGMSSRVLHAETHRVPEDHKTIQAAVDVSETGDVVLVSPGTYGERIRLKPGVTLRSAGDDSKGKLGLKRSERTILDGGGKVGETPGVSMAEGAVLDGFTVTNAGQYDDASWKQHHATHGNNQKHEHIGHFGVPGIGIMGVNCTVRNNIVHHNGSTGIAIRGDDGKMCIPRVTHNVCYRNMGGGIGSMNGSQGIISENICFQNFYAGIGHDNASPMVIQNTCYENVRAGIGVSEGSQAVVRNNKCYRNRRAGIGIRTGETTRPVIEDNDCYENDMAGIGSDEHSAPIIRNNRCYKNKMVGIGSQDGARALIVGNICYENKMAGIGVRGGARSLIIENECRKNQLSGIGVTTEEQTVLIGNKCIQNKLVALGLPRKANAVVYNNEFARTGGMPPLIVVGTGAKALFVNNVIKGGGIAGLLLQGDALIIGNRFQGNGPRQGMAVWARKNSNVNVHDNQFDGYRNALRADDSNVSASGNQISNFQKTAIIVRKSTTPAHLFGNEAISGKEGDVAVNIQGEQGIVADNKVIPPTE